MKVKGPMKKAAAAIVGDASTPDEKLERLYRYCRSAIRNIQHDSSEMTADAREAVKRNKKPADTLTRGVGTGYDINMLFAALATAAGFDARWAMLADRGTIFFDSNFADPYFLNSYNVAVRVGDGWRFFDPSQPYLPSGMLRWQEEGVDALISDPVNGLFVRTPLSRSRQSVTKRRATLRLGEDGTLEGKVRIEFSGHSGIAMRERYGSHSPEQREDSLREGVKKRLSSAELESVKVENATDPDKAFAYEYDVRVPGYAQRTGKRLFLQPAFFQRSKEPVFQTSERKHDINFPHPWSEQDTVTIELPLGYELENAESPGGGGPEGMYDARLQLADERTLIYKRSVRFGDNSRILFPAAEYPVLKQQFDLMHKLDNHTVSLKQSESAVRN